MRILIWAFRALIFFTLAMVPSWWRHRREVRRLLPSPDAAPAPGVRKDSPPPDLVPEHPPRDGL